MTDTSTAEIGLAYRFIEFQIPGDDNSTVCIPFVYPEENDPPW